MAQKLEVEFRVYRTREPGAKRECIATRSIPHALQVWNESVDAYSRSLELVISGDWLMEQLQSSESGRGTRRVRARANRRTMRSGPGYRRSRIHAALLAGDPGNAGPQRKADHKRTDLLEVMLLFSGAVFSCCAAP